MTERTGTRGEIVPVEQTTEDIRIGALVVASPELVIPRATQLAEALAKVVKEKRLFKRIRSKDFVRVEGWATLGAMLGVVAREVPGTVIPYNRIAGSGWQAEVEIVRTRDGQRVGYGSSICSREEDRWAKADDYAIRSMAVTRAAGKAFRLGYAWIMALAGFAGTPAEEMNEEDEELARAAAARGKKAEGKSAPAEEWNAQLVARVLNDADIVSEGAHRNHVLGLLEVGRKSSAFSPATADDEIVRLLHVYRRIRIEAEQDEVTMTPSQAMDLAVERLKAEDEEAELKAAQDAVGGAESGEAEEAKALAAQAEARAREASGG